MAIDAAAAHEWPDGNDVPAAPVSCSTSGRARSTTNLIEFDSRNWPPSVTATNSGSARFGLRTISTVVTTIASVTTAGVLPMNRLTYLSTCVVHADGVIGAELGEPGIQPSEERVVVHHGQEPADGDSATEGHGGAGDEGHARLGLRVVVAAQVAEQRRVPVDLGGDRRRLDRRRLEHRPTGGDGRHPEPDEPGDPEHDRRRPRHLPYPGPPTR